MADVYTKFTEAASQKAKIKQGKFDALTNEFISSAVLDGAETADDHEANGNRAGYVVELVAYCKKHLADFESATKLTIDATGMIMTKSRKDTKPK